MDSSKPLVELDVGNTWEIKCSRIPLNNLFVELGLLFTVFSYDDS